MCTDCKLRDGQFHDKVILQHVLGVAVGLQLEGLIGSLLRVPRAVQGAIMSGGIKTQDNNGTNPTEMTG